MNFKDALQKTKHVVAMKFPSKYLSFVNKNLKSELLHLKEVKNVIPIENDTHHKIVLWNYSDKNSISQDKLNSLEKFINEQGEKIEWIENYEVKFGYDQMTTEEVLKEVLPQNMDIQTGFELVGHIAHLNLKDQLLPYKQIIGQVILDKNPIVETVVNKLGQIDSQFREFKMEVLAGKEDFDVDLKEHGCRFQFNYSQVYWNSKLSTEHQRLLKYFSKNEIVCDMFAGVGPFAVPAAKKISCQIFANDLNPKSYEYLQRNAKLNKVQSLIHCFNLDGREFVKHLVHQKQQPFHHVIMNLPASATEFLDVFIGLYTNAKHLPLPIIHCYTFVKVKQETDNKYELAKQSVFDVLQVASHLKEKVEFVELYDVRDVSNKKNMICVSFKLPSFVAYQETQDMNSKKRKLELEQQETNEEIKFQKK